MMQPPAVALGIRLRVLAEDPAASAAQVVPDAPVGDHTDAATVSNFAAGCDVLTFDHEHVPAVLLTKLESDGVTVRPGSAALLHAQDKAVMRQRLGTLGIPWPRWRLGRDEAELTAFGVEVCWPLGLKTPRGGYDRKGGRLRDDPARAAGRRARSSGPGPLRAGAAGWLARSSGREPLLAEERVPFRRELAVLVARSPSGQAAAWPVVETIQVDGVCREVVAPAPGLSADVAAHATDLALRIAGALDVVGVLAVGMFEVDADGGPAGLGNELAMRPHNSGHWAIDGARTRPVEQHPP